MAKYYLRYPSTTPFTLVQVRMFNMGQLLSSTTLVYSGNTSQNVQHGPTPLPLNIKYNNAPIPPAVGSQDLSDIDKVAKANEHFITTLDSPGTLAQILVREAVFGTDTMGKSTPSGTKELYALPKEGLTKIKTVIFQYYPRMWSTPSEFESIWHKCQVAIEQCCGRIRRRQKKRVNTSENILP